MNSFYDKLQVGLSVGHLASLYNYDMKEYVKAELLYLRFTMCVCQSFTDEL